MVRCRSGRAGAKYTVGGRGRRATVGIPGTGLFYTQQLSGGGSRRSRRGSAGADTVAVRPQDRLTLGFFKRLFTPDDEAALVDGCRALVRGDKEAALGYLRQAVHLADGAYLAGFVSLSRGEDAQAESCLKTAAEKHRRLNTYFSKYGMDALIGLPVTEEVTAWVEPNVRGVLLGLVEICQRQQRLGEAMDYVQRLRVLSPDDVVVKLSQAELLLESGPEDKKSLQRVVRLGEKIDNETAVHANLLLYRARALRLLGLATAARDTLSTALRRKKDRSDELLWALRYERGLAYRDMGHKGRARSDFEKLYLEAPEYEDVAERLGL